MKKLMVYPYNRETTSIARWKDLLENYELVSLVGTKGWGLDNRDASILDKGKETGIIVSEDFEAEIKKCDCVYFNEVINEQLLDKYLDKLKTAYDEGKEILMSQSLYKKLSVKDISYMNIKVIDSEDDGDFFEKEYKAKIYKLSTPIIGVFGSGDYCSKFDVQLGVRKQFAKEGYKIFQLGTKAYSRLFGFNSLPDFLFTNSMSMEEKILRFNHYIHYIELTEQPDLIILGIPGGILPLSDEYTNHFGEMSLILSKAVPIDIGILSTYYTRQIEAESLEELRTYCRYALQCDMDYINLTNMKQEKDPSADEIYYTTIDNTKVEKFIEDESDEFAESSLNLFSILNEDDTKRICEKIIDDLSENIIEI